MSDTRNYDHIIEGMDDRKKQKAGLNAVRPDDFTEQKFKDMAKELNLSQTDMFKHIFWSYIREQNNERRQLALNLEAEINLISKDLNSVLQHFKSISERAQDTVISIKTNAEQTEKNLTLDIDTLLKKVDELSKRNAELELSNTAFTEIKTGLEAKLSAVTEANDKKDVELKEAREIIKTRDKTIKDMEKQIDLLEKTNAKSEQESNRLHDDVKTLETKVKSFETTNNSLNDTLNRVNALKASEIASIEAKYQLHITELEEKLNRFEESKEKELQQIKTSLKAEYEADKKMAVADIKMELADIKSKYGEVLIENAGLKGAASNNGGR